MGMKGRARRERVLLRIIREPNDALNIQISDDLEGQERKLWWDVAAVVGHMLRLCNTVATGSAAKTARQLAEGMMKGRDHADKDS